MAHAIGRYTSVVLRLKFEVDETVRKVSVSFLLVGMNKLATVNHKALSLRNFSNVSSSRPDSYSAHVVSQCSKAGLHKCAWIFKLVVGMLLHYKANKAELLQVFTKLSSSWCA